MATKKVTEEEKVTAKKAPVMKAEKPAAKAVARKGNIVFESPLGGAITPEAIIKKLPKEAVNAHVKVEENTIYWVGKNGETGSVEIW